MMKIGQPLGRLTQFAYVVEDIQRSMKDFSDRLGIGPWFVSGPFVPPEGVYRGRPTDMKLTLAIAFSGSMTVELIQQHDDKPSVYQEFIAKRGYGFHHWAIGSRDLDGTVADYRSRGFDVAFSDRSPRGVRIAGDTVPGMLEIIEVTDALEDIYLDMYKASLDWDGSQPVRKAVAIDPKS
jgi:hypothetical protein